MLRRLRTGTSTTPDLRRDGWTGIGDAARGVTDACVAAFDELTAYGVLNWGETSLEESICPNPRN
jgi:hypothetical protein